MRGQYDLVSFRVLFYAVEDDEGEEEGGGGEEGVRGGGRLGAWRLDPFLGFWKWDRWVDDMDIRSHCAMHVLGVLSIV